MNTLLLRRDRRLVPAMVVLLVAGATLALTSSPARAATTTPSSNLLCTTDPANNFSLVAETGYISTPDGNQILMWGYGTAGGSSPTPVRCCA